MRLLWTLLFLTIIFADISSTAIASFQSLSICSDYSKCNDLDINEESSAEHRQRDQQQNCHCHTSHFALAIIYDIKKINIKPNLLSDNLTISLKVGIPKNYLPMIARPPIS